jgi:hypothetical protein
MKMPGSYNIIRFLALTIGALASLFYVFFLVGEGVGDLFDGKIGAIPILVMILFTVSGYVLSWFRVRKGAIIMIAGALVMGIYLLIVGAKGNVLMALAFSLPFLLPGLMLMSLKRLSKTKED